MAGSMKDIKLRIKSVESTMQITKAMELVASSKMRRAKERVEHSRPYFETLHETLTKIAAADPRARNPYLRRDEVKRTLLIVIAGDRGLAGGYNSNVLKLVYSQIQDKEATVLPIGKKAVDSFKSKGIPVLTDSYAEAASVGIGDCFSIAKQLCKAFLDGQYDEVYVAYTDFVSMLAQSPDFMKLLPLEKPLADPNGKYGGIVYEPSNEEVFDAIIPEYLGGQLYGALCESRASEQAARRTAMDNATQNAEEMIADLSLKFNRARQAAITQEITEIVAGS